MKILIIDDDSKIIDIWAIVLRANGHTVFGANNGKEGITKSKTHMPDLILLDEIMPDMLGNEVLAIIKNDPDTKIIPIAILSNYSEEHLIQEALSQGAIDYILKYQIDPQDLSNRINLLVKDLQKKVEL